MSEKTMSIIEGKTNSVTNMRVHRICLVLVVFASLYSACCTELLRAQDTVSIHVSPPEVGNPPAPPALPRLEAAVAESASASPRFSASETVELSVEPGSQSLLPADRPAWIGADPDLSGEVHRLFVGSTAVSDRSEADAALDVPLMAAVNAYIQDQVLQIVPDEENAGGRSLELDDEFIRRNMLQDREGLVLELNTSGEPMYQKWVTVEITPTQRELIRQWHREGVQRERIKPLALGLAGLLGLVGLSHLLLRRKHGLASALPLNDEPLAAKPSGKPAKVRRAAGFWAPLIILGGLLFLVGMILLPFLAYRSQADTGAKVRHHRPHEARGVVVEVYDHRSTGRSSGDLQEFRYESGGQEIIKRVQQIR